jgi:hypothetical protein
MELANSFDKKSKTSMSKPSSHIEEQFEKEQKSNPLVLGQYLPYGNI